MIKNRFPNRLPEWLVQWAILPAAWFIFFGGVWLAAHRFPREYDWRTMTISLLLSVRENPHGYWVIALGISLAGLIQIPLPGFFYHRLRSMSPLGARLGWVFMVLGIAAMVLMGITPKHPPFFPRAHDLLAMIAFVGLVLSVIINTGLVVRQGFSRAAPKESIMSWNWILLTAMALIPILGTGLSQLCLYFFAGRIGQTPLAWRNHGAPYVLSLAFWEWITCVFLIVYLMLLTWLTRRSRSEILKQ